MTPWPDPPYRIPISSGIWGSLTYKSYGQELPERSLAPVDQFVEIIAARCSEPWLYHDTEFFAQFLGSDSPSVALKLFPIVPFPYARPLPPDYRVALLGAIRTQNAMHGLRELEAVVDYYYDFHGTYQQNEGQLSSGLVQLAGPIFVADIALLAGTMILEIDVLGPDTYPHSEKDQVLHFLKATLDQWNALPPQDPFMEKQAEEGAYSYNLVRQLGPRPEVHPYFSNSMAASVTATLIAFLAGLQELYYVHFEVLQVNDQGPLFVATGVVAINDISTSGSSSEGAAVDIA